MKRILTIVCFVLMLAAVSAALADADVTFTPEHPRVGDYVDVVVTPDREDPKDVAYALYYGEEQDRVFSGKATQHFTASFRPRKEGSYTLRVTVTYESKEQQVIDVKIPVSGEAPPQESPDVVYSQKDGWWKSKKYADTELQTAGCAIFTISSALQRMGYTGEDIMPEKLARTYVFYKDGTWNEGLVNKCGEVYDYLTQKELIRSSKEIAACLRRGDMFSFSIVDRHIALADGISEDGTKIHVVDSAPGATFERIRFEGCIFYQNEDGSFTEARVPEDLPGIRYFPEAPEYGYSGMAYWMDIEYCANRGMRLIRQPWLKADLGEGLQGVSVEYAGSMLTKVTRDKVSYVVPTRDLTICSRSETSAPQVVMVTVKNGTFLLDGNGKRMKKTVNGNSVDYKIRRQEMAMMIDRTEDSVYIAWGNVFGYLPLEDVEILPAAADDFRTGILVNNGNTNGSYEVVIRLKPDKNSTGLFKIKTGTPVAITEKQEAYYLVEAGGCRGWVNEKFVLLDEEKTGENKN